MSIFLIDYENLHTSAFNGLEELTENDRIVVFYTHNSDNLTFSLMQRLVKSPAKIDYLQVATGVRNSLDFQLCSYLGYLIGTYHDTRLCIVSRDKGFSTMLSFWSESTENGNTLICCTNIHNGNAPRDAQPEETTEAAAEHQEEPAETAAAPEEPSAEEPPVEAAEITETPQPEEAAAAEKQPVEKPKRKYNRRAPYKRKPKAPEEQTA